MEQSMLVTFGEEPEGENWEIVDLPTSPAEIERVLSQFSGTNNYYRISPLFPSLVCTDGVKAMADLCGAYWLLDVIVSYQPKLLKNARFREYQFWTLKVKNGRGVVTCQEDSGIAPAVRQVIQFTDFPLAEIKIWNEGGVLLLPSEH